MLRYSTKKESKLGGGRNQVTKVAALVLASHEHEASRSQLHRSQDRVEVLAAMGLVSLGFAIYHRGCMRPSIEFHKIMSWILNYWANTLVIYCHLRLVYRELQVQIRQANRDQIMLGRGSGTYLFMRESKQCETLAILLHKSKRDSCKFVMMSCADVAANSLS